MRIRQITIKYSADPSGTQISAGQTLKDPRTAAGILIPMLKDEAQEVFVILLLTVRGRLIGKHEISRGGLTATEVSPRLIFRAALLTDAHGIILAHNHPSGDPSPSAEDIALTRRIADGCRLLGELQVLDHIIVGEDRYFSMKESGIL